MTPTTNPTPQNELLEAAKEARQMLSICTDEDEAKEILPLLARLDLAIRNAEQGGGG